MEALDEEVGIELSGRGGAEFFGDEDIHLAPFQPIEHAAYLQVLGPEGCRGFDKKVEAFAVEGFDFDSDCSVVQYALLLGEAGH